MKNKLNILLILIICFLPISTLYCSSSCIDYVGVCSGPNYNQCNLCDTKIFDIIPVGGICSLNNQTQIVAVDLQNSASLSSFKTNNINSMSCGTYFLSGNYSQGNYLSKTYSTASPHYLILLRFNIAFMGVWSSSDYIIVSIDNQPYSFAYSCGVPDNICTAVGNGNDCIKIKSINTTHNTSSALISFESSIVSGAVITQTWGIKDLMVVLKTCNERCTACFGPANTQCLSCSAGFYLLGNVCEKTCPVYSMPGLNVCVLNCPSNYYVEQSTNTCQICSEGCSVCNGPLYQNCILSGNEPSLWDKQKEFWIFLIILGLVIVFTAVGCLIQKKRNEKKVQQINPLKQSLNENMNIVTQNNIQPINNLNQSEMDLKKQENGTQQKNNIFQNAMEMDSIKSEFENQNVQVSEFQTKKKKKKNTYDY